MKEGKKSKFPSQVSRTEHAFDKGELLLSLPLGGLQGRYVNTQPAATSKQSL